jgi:hypothetical protein
VPPSLAESRVEKKTVKAVSKHQSSKLTVERNTLLEILWTNHRLQLPKLNDVTVWGLMLSLGLTVRLNHVRMLLRTLKDFDGYLSFKEKSRAHTKIQKIKLTVAGVVLLDPCEAGGSGGRDV